MALEREGKISTMVGSIPKLISDEMAFLSAVVYGGYGEGAINTKTERTINLDEYLNSIPKSNFPMPVEGSKTKNLIEQLRIIYGMEKKHKSKLLKEVEESTGYVPFYDLDKLSLKYRHPSSIVNLWWSNKNRSELYGFCRHVYSSDKKDTVSVMSDAAFLVQTHDRPKLVVEHLIDDARVIGWPVATDPEGVMSEEKRGKMNGSRWSEILYRNRKKALAMGCKFDVYFSLEKGVRNQDISDDAVVYEAVTKPRIGKPLFFVVTDLKKSCETLKKELEI